MTDEKIRAAWKAYHGPVNDIYGDEIPQAPPAYSRGYRDGYAACEADSHAPAVIQSLKNQIALMRFELRDALSMAYGASMNWPRSARELLGMDE